MNSKNGLPKTGIETTTLFVLLITGAVLIVAVVLIKIKVVDQEINKHE